MCVINCNKQTLREIKKSTMTYDNGLRTNNKKWIKMIMKTPICLNNKGNEVIAWCSFNIWSCFLLSDHHHYMFCRHQCSLHHIYASWISNDNIHQGLEVVFTDKDINLLSNVMREKVGDFPLNMCSILQSNSGNNIQSVSCAIICSLSQGH